MSVKHSKLYVTFCLSALSSPLVKIDNNLTILHFPEQSGTLYLLPVFAHFKIFGLFRDPDSGIWEVWRVLWKILLQS